MTQKTYSLEKQIGFLLRRATQRHLSIFGAHIAELTPTQFAAIAKLASMGSVSQNELGRETAMDGATIKGVIDRLSARGLVVTRPDDTDKRRLLVALSDDGQSLWDIALKQGHRITEETLEPLRDDEREQFLKLLEKIT